MNEFETALAAVQAFGSGKNLTRRIASLEGRLQSRTREEARRVVADEGITDSMMSAALLIKAASGQIDVIVHAVGILMSLPYVLSEGEVVESLSLGAGNTGRAHDLETDRQIAEFKFIEWRGGPESIRQNSVFVDLFNLASATTRKRRVLYLVGTATALRFLNNRRAIASVLSRDTATAARFRAQHGSSFVTVREYYEAVRADVEIIDLRELVPTLRGGET